MKFTSKVKPGFGRGKSLSFPTFNLEIPDGFKQKYGVYAARVWINDKIYRGALHFGPIPTYDIESPSLEIFVLDYADDTPVQELNFEIVEFIREIKKFRDPEELKNQINSDVQAIRAIPL